MRGQTAKGRKCSFLNGLQHIKKEPVSVIKGEKCG
jgi:hypothetical protein